jgi:uncharacterized protein YcgI (DUF1989 family)
MSAPLTIPPRSGKAFRLMKGQTLTVTDVEGEQVSDLVAFNSNDIREAISSGRSLDYASKLYLSTGDAIYSNRSNVMLRIVDDTVGRHDFPFDPLLKGHFQDHLWRSESPSGVLWQSRVGADAIWNQCR